jgi:DNA-binding CsgD family transcriptional regulator
MLSGSTVLIVTPDRLAGIGLRSILESCYRPTAVHVQADLDPSRLDRYDYVFLSADAHLRYHGALASARASVIVLTRDDHRHEDHRYPLILWTGQDEARIIEDLERLQKRRRPAAKAKASGLSSRELEVLKLVAKGHINKHIADALSISLHTVISHRKNITAKLGIKTIAGLTMYAVLNGLVSSKDAG